MKARHTAVDLFLAAGVMIAGATTAASASALSESGTVGSHADATLVGQSPMCRPIAVDGGGEEGSSEGGEGGEGGESGSSASTREASSSEGGEGGEGGEETTAEAVLAPDQQFRDRQIIADFVDVLVLPNYELLAQRSTALSAAIAAFVATPTDATLAIARQAWLATRQPWEQSEAFAFGPAATLGLDAELDDWPLNETDVQAVLESPNALTPEYVASLQTSQKGFHAIAFLLFGTDADKPLDSFSDRELEYLAAIGPVFEQTATALLLSWAEGLDGFPAYGDEFKTAGESSNTYLTEQAAGEEIVQGILGILDELGNVKIGEALETQNPFLLEARFAQSSLQDFQDNLLSAQNTYLGKFPAGNIQGKGLQAFVASVDPALDAELQAQMQEAQTAVAAIPGPIEITLCDPAARPQIETAVDSIAKLFETFEQRVLPLVQQ